MTKTAAPTSGAERLTNLERVLRSLINRALHARATNIRITTGMRALVIEDDGAAEADTETVLRNIDRSTPVASSRPIRELLVGRQMLIASRNAPDVGWTSHVTNAHLKGGLPRSAENADHLGANGTGIVMNLLPDERGMVERVARHAALNYRSRITVDGCRIQTPAPNTTQQQPQAA